LKKRRPFAEIWNTLAEDSYHHKTDIQGWVRQMGSGYGLPLNTAKDCRNCSGSAMSVGCDEKLQRDIPQLQLFPLRLDETVAGVDRLCLLTAQVIDVDTSIYTV
jgi:hypothetical protein